jgi:hypothetical protein
MAARLWLNVVVLTIVLVSHRALAQDKPPELTPAGKAILEGQVAADRVTPNNFPGQIKPAGFPLAMCAFSGGLCGAVNRDGTVAVFPRYDWVGTFSDNRAAVRLGGLYGFVDEAGREIVTPQYRIVDDYKFGFAQVDVDGKSGLIDRDGKMVIEPKYGFIEAISPDRFRVSEVRQLGGTIGSEDFSGMQTTKSTAFGINISLPVLRDTAAGVIDKSGQWIEPPGTSWSPAFDKDDPSIRWVRRDKLWGLARADGTWLVEPKFEQADPLGDGLARVKLDGKFGFIDRAGHFAIDPVFDMAWWFEPGIGRTSAERDGIVGVIDKAGSWVFQTNYQQINLAVVYGKDRSAGTVFGWNFKKDDRWGLLDLDGRVVLDADFDQSLQRCADGRLQAYKNKEWLLFKQDGSPLLPGDGRLVDATCGSVPPYTLKIGDKFGLVDASFNPLTPVHFDAIFRGASGIRNAKIDGKWGRIGSDGRWLLEPKFDYLSNGADIFVASLDGKRGFMRSDGSWLIEPKFDAAQYRSDDTAFVTVAGATGVLRLSDQSWAIAPRPGVMCDTRNAIMSQADGKRVILSRTGETWIDIGTERIGLNLDFGLLTFLKNGKWGLVDTAGQVMTEPQFDEPVYFSPKFRGIAWAKRDGKWCAIDRHGRSVPGVSCADADPTGPSQRFECKVEP